MLAAMCTDAYQRSFFTKLYSINQLPLLPSTLRAIYVYASAPIGIVAVVAITASLLGATTHAIPWPLVIGAGIANCIGAVFTDSLLRITQTSALIANIIRICIIGATLYLLRLLLLPTAAGGTANDLLAVGCAVTQLLLTTWLARQPIVTRYALLRAPIVEGCPGVVSALPLRALRTARYVGSNLILATLMIFVFLTARAKVPIIPLDGMVFISLLLIGTLGQEVRTLSAARYPTELTLYGVLGRWLVGTWLLAVIHGLLWIDVCLGIVHVWSPHGLTIGSAQAGLIGLSCIAVGILAGSLVVPGKQDILAQCGSTVIYGALVWAVLKVPTTALGARIYPLAWAAIVCVFCLMLAYICERRRWRQTVKGHHAGI
jgi:hypothetical protein